MLLLYQALYKEDWLGLKRLIEAGGLFFESALGEHMQFTLRWFELLGESSGCIPGLTGTGLHVTDRFPTLLHVVLCYYGEVVCWWLSACLPVQSQLR
jgi:hypothetical protein